MCPFTIVLDGWEGNTCIRLFKVVLISVCTIQRHTHNIAWLAEHSVTQPRHSPGQCAVSLWCKLDRFKLHHLALFYD